MNQPTGPFINRNGATSQSVFAPIAEVLPDYDEKGRKRVDLMTDRELLEECVTWQRITGDTIERFMDGLASNPMMKAMAGRFGLK